MQASLARPETGGQVPRLAQRIGKLDIQTRAVAQQQRNAAGAGCRNRLLGAGDTCGFGSATNLKTSVPSIASSCDTAGLEPQRSANLNVP